MNTLIVNLQQTMTSLEIAELTGKQHKNVMQAIRNMEPAWEKVNGLKFQLVEYKDAKGELRPCYQLTKTECLYIATKFNDEARAKLVLRWEELEMADVRGIRNATLCNAEKMADVRGIRNATLCNAEKMAAERCLSEPKKILALADDIIGEALRQLNAGAEDTLTATQVAKTFNMTVYDFNCIVRDMGIQYRRHGRWNISDDLVGRDLVRLRTHVSYSLRGEKKVRTYMTWTMQGLRYLNAKLGYPNF